MADTKVPWPVAPKRKNEQAALDSLRQFDILDTEAEECFDVISRLATQFLDSPVSLISFVDDDRQWWKSCPGMNMFVGNKQQLPRSEGFCQWVVGTDAPLLLLDPENDDRFRDNPGWKALRIGFYAGVPIRDEAGNPLGSFCVLGPKRESFSEYQMKILHDLGSMVVRELNLRLTNRRLKDAKDAAVSAAQAKGRFLANMSHELRTPMNAIVGMSECLARTQLAQQQREFVDIIQASCDQLLFIINGVLDYSKIESGKIELEQAPFSLRKCIEMAFDVQATASAKKGVELIYLPQPMMTDCYLGDAARIQQIMLNIVGNAMKFTKRGEISVTSSYDVQTKKLQICVRDTGIGMKEDVVANLFKPFVQAEASTTREYGGTGLGLAICKCLAELMGGEIHCSSKVGEGTCFCITLCLETATCMDLCVADVQALHGKTVALQCDHKLITEALSAQLKCWNMNIMPLDSKIVSTTPVNVIITTNLNNVTNKPTVVLAPMGTEIEETATRKVIFKPFKRDRLQKVLLEFLGPKDTKTASKPESFSTPLPLIHILIAEDNIVNQRVVVHMLAKLNQTKVVVTENGQECLKKLESSPERFDLIFMDMQMPIMDGVTATKLIRSDTAYTPFKHIKIIGMTANGMLEDKNHCLEAGMDDYLAKPVKLSMLDCALRLHFGK